MRQNFGRPRIYDYEDYRLYLSAMCNHIVKTDSQLSSFRKLSIHLGFRSQNFLKMVINGERNLSPESLKKVADGISLKPKEKMYFKSLVNFNQATTVDDKAHYGFEVVRSNINPDSCPIKKSQLRYLSETHYITLREMVQIKNFNEDPKAIAKSLIPQWTPGQVEKAIKELIKFKYLKRNDQGKLELNNQVVSTGEVRSWSNIQKTALEKFHKTMAQLAEQSLNKVSHKDRDISGVTVTLSRAKMVKAREILAQTRKQLLELEQDEQFIDENDQEVFRVNLQLFPLTQWAKKRSKK